MKDKVVYSILLFVDAESTDKTFEARALGFKIAEIPIKYRERLGEKKLKWRHGFEIANKIITQKFSDKPVSQQPSG